METGVIVPVVILSVIYKLAHITHNRRENRVLNINNDWWTLFTVVLTAASQLYRCNISLVTHKQNK